MFLCLFFFSEPGQSSTCQSPCGVSRCWAERGHCCAQGCSCHVRGSRCEEENCCHRRLDLELQQFYQNISEFSMKRRAKKKNIFTLGAGDWPTLIETNTMIVRSLLNYMHYDGGGGGRGGSIVSAAAGKRRREACRQDPLPFQRSRGSDVARRSGGRVGAQRDRRCIYPPAAAQIRKIATQQGELIFCHFATE